MAINLELYIKEVLGEKELSEISDAFLERMDDLKDVQTQRGRSAAKGVSWSNDASKYSKEYAKKQGRRSPVTLRSNKGSRSIERTQIKDKGSGKKRLIFTGTTSSGEDADRVFYMHDRGTAKGNKTRQIYPRDNKQIPDEAMTAARIKLQEILSRNG